MKLKKTKAFTLAETLVAIVVGTITVAGIFAAYNYYNKTHSAILLKSSISQTARDSLTILSRDLRNAGYVDLNYTKVARPEIKLINLRQNYYQKLDSLAIWYTPDPNNRMRIYYRPFKYKDSNRLYLAREVVMNPEITGQVIYDNVEFIPYISDFQVVFRDKDGNELTPVCFYCGSVENSQGAQNVSNGYTLGQSNMQKVHTVEIYLTVESPKEYYNQNKQIRIQNHSGSNGNIQTFNDKYYRETFFISVHTRNLATPLVKASSSGQSISVGQGYNQ